MRYERADGAILPGDYLFIVVHGLASVKFDPANGALAANQRLTVADGAGTVRPLRSAVVDGMTITEGAPVVGVTVASTQDGMVLVLVNP